MENSKKDIKSTFTKDYKSRTKTRTKYDGSKLKLGDIGINCLIKI